MWVAVAWALIKTAAMVAIVRGLARLMLRAGNAGGLTIVLVVAFLLRLAWILVVHPEPISDAEWYHERAKDLATQFQYTFAGRPTARLPPGFPMVLATLYAIAGPSPALGVGLNLCLTVAGVGLVYAVARRLFDEPTALVAALITAVWPGQVPYASVLLSEPLFNVLFLLGFLAALRAAQGGPGTSLLAGCCFGAAALTRPVALLAASLGGVVVWLRKGGVRRSVTSAALMCLGTAIVIMPWMARNYMAFGHIVPVASSSGIALWQGNNPATTALPSDATQEPYPDLADREIERDRRASQEATAFIRAHPLTALRFFVAKLDRTYETDDEVTQWSLSVGRPLPGVVTRLFQRAATTYFNTMMLLFCGFTLLVFLPAARLSLASWAQVVLPVVYLAVLQAVFISQYRYNYPALPFIAIGAAVVVRRVDEWTLAR